MAVVSVVVLLERSVGLLSNKFPPFHRLIEPQPALVVADGRFCFEEIDAESLALDDILSALRLAGVADLGEIRRAYLEPSGRVSVFRAQAPVATLSILPGSSDLERAIEDGRRLAAGR
jgi:uncharacterized membrane protein YcaP (DUF421 family)